MHARAHTPTSARAVLTSAACTHDAGAPCVRVQGIGTNPSTVAKDIRMLSLRISFVTTLIMRDLTGRNVATFGPGQAPAHDGRAPPAPPC